MGIKTGLIKICKTCGKEFWVYRSRIDEKKFCSMDCYRKDHIGRKLSPYAKMVAIRTLKENDKKRKANMRRGLDHPIWKGDKAGYRAIHYWVFRIKGKPGACSLCGKEGRNQWSNIDHKYRRVPEDYFSACSSCHKHYDIRMKGKFDA